MCEIRCWVPGKYRRQQYGSCSQELAVWWKRDSSNHISALYSLPIAAVTNYTKQLLETTHIYYLIVLKIRSPKWAKSHWAKN